MIFGMHEDPPKCLVHDRPLVECMKTFRGIADLPDPPPTQPDVCHCTGITIAPMPAPHTKYESGCVFNQVAAELARTGDVDPRLTRAGNCRCGQVRDHLGVMPHKLGIPVRCAYYTVDPDKHATGRSANNEWAHGDNLRVDRTFENEFTMNRHYFPNTGDW